MTIREDYTVCVIIPTFQRRVFVEEAVTHLLATDFPHERLELFISDGGSTDGSAERVRELAGQTNIKLTWYSDKDLRVSAARHYAIEHTDADIVLFLDDDCITRPNWVRALAEPLARGDADITAGSDRAPDDDPFLAQCEDVAFGSLIGSGGVRGDASGPSVEFCPMSCNMGLLRKTMVDLGSFDERLRFVEDTEFVYRARKHGCKVAHIPEATVLHRRRATIRGVCHHNYVRGYGRTYLQKRYPDQRQFAFFLPALALKAGIFLVAFGWIWPITWTILLWGMALYGILLAITGIAGVKRTGNPLAFFVVAFLVAMHHLWYALGTLHAPLTGYRKVFALDRTDIADPFGVREKQTSSEE